MSADFSYEISVDGHFDNYYVVKRNGVKFGHIFLLDEGKKKYWSVWVGLNMVARKTMWSEAWAFMKTL